MDIFNAIVKTLPALGKLIGALIALGKSPDEAADLVIQDMTSRREQYEAEKAADEKALNDKHGRPE
jgi:hypothetical protein